MTDESLSDSIFWDNIHNQWNVPACEVKKFVKKLKEEFLLYRTDKYKQLILTPKDNYFIKQIDKIFGEEISGVSA